jgi:hypothetical protein
VSKQHPVQQRTITGFAVARQQKSSLMIRAHEHPERLAGRIEIDPVIWLDMFKPVVKIHYNLVTVNPSFTIVFYASRILPY